MSTLTAAQQEILQAPLHQWRPLYWEPVGDSGERLMVGVVHAYGGNGGAVRTIRDDVLDALYGQKSAGARNLLDAGLSMFAAMAETGPLDPLEHPMMGLYPGPLRRTAARSLGELLHTAALLYSSVANMDKLDELQEADAPQQEEVNRRFSTEVREAVALLRPDLLPGFGQGGVLVPGGQRVRFGYFSPTAVVHFTVLSAVRQAAGMRDARARLFELQRARDVAGILQAALIAAVPRDDDPTLGPRQRDALRANRAEIESEADAVGMCWHAVTAVPEAAERVIELAA